MSTRSGKRIHASVDSPTVETEIILQSERKTRTKKQKENVELSVKKRHNYVSYPADEDTASVSSEATETQEKVKRTRRLRRDTLKEINCDNVASNSKVSIEGSKSVRKSRRGKKALEECENHCDNEIIQTHEQLKPTASEKQKIKKKKNHKKVSLESTEVQELGSHVIKKKFIKKKKRSDSFVVHTHDGEQNEIGNLNKSNTSADSFHSAAGSPMNENQTKESGNFIQCDSRKSLSQTITESSDVSTTVNTTLVAVNKKERKCSIKNNSLHIIDAKTLHESNLNTSIDKTTKELTDFTSRGDVSTKKKRKSNINNSTFDKIETKDADVDKLNETFDKGDNAPRVFDSEVDISTRKRRKSSIKNSTFDKIEAVDADMDNLNTTFEKISEATKMRRNSSINNSTFDKIETRNANVDNLNATFEKHCETTTVLKSELDVSAKKRRKSSILNSTFDKTETNGMDPENLNATYNKSNDLPRVSNPEVDVSRRKRRKSSIKNSTIDEIETNDADKENLNTTFDKTNEVLFISEVDVPRKRKKSSIKNQKNYVNGAITVNNTDFDSTFDCINAADSLSNNDSTNETGKVNGELLKIEKSNDFQDPCNNDLSKEFDSIMNKDRKSSHRNSMINNLKKDLEDPSETQKSNATFEIVDASLQNSTFDIESSLANNLIQNIIITTEKDLTNNIESHDNEVDKNKIIELNATFDADRKSDKSDDSKKSSLISSDATVNSTFDNSRISITSDESKTENILNHTPVLIESSIDESGNLEDKTPEKLVLLTPLKRESTFTKEGPDAVASPKPKSPEETPSKRKSSPGHTPYPFSKSSQKKQCIMNVTRSIEKPILEQRQTRVMFCSPVNNPVAIAHVKGRVIKSNLKGSNKSFVFDDSAPSAARAGRKRSLTLGEADTRAKRSRLAGALQPSVERLSRPRTVSAAAKVTDPGTPPKAKAESRVTRTRLPNFAALHQKQFARMESLDECRARRAQRARLLLTPTGCAAMLDRISPKGTPPQTAAPAKESTGKLHTPAKPKLPTLESLNPGYTRFGFKLKTDVNPFSVTKKTEPKRQRATGESRQNTRQNSCLLPSLAGATVSRRDVAKQAVMREKSFTEKRDATRSETRTVIKGVRTNRRFELQMKLRNVDA